MSKLCVVNNMAAKYRAPIFLLMDREFDVDWYFGELIGDIKGLDTSFLRNATIIGRRTCKDLTWQRGVINLLLRNEYDRYIMTGEPFALSTWWFMLLKYLIAPSKKVYLWSHGWYGREGFLKKLMKRAFFGMADCTFLYGNYAKHVAIKQGFPTNKLEVIHNSLDHANQVALREKLTPSHIYREYFGNDNPVLIFIGRLTSVKRLDLLIDALEVLSIRGENCNAVFVGDGETRKDLEALVNEKGLSNQVWFYGACYDDSKNAQLIYDADLCVAPGNVGLTAMHTMVFGTPVLTHDNFPMQMPEFEAIRDGKTGAFFRYNDVDSMVDSISSWLLSAKGRRDEIRQECYNEIDNYWTPEFQIEILKKRLSL